MNYKKTFDPKDYNLLSDSEVKEKYWGYDLRDGSVYVFDERIVLAVNIAIATDRPLLVLGPPGSGKSSLAAFVARSLSWNYYEKVITSRTSAQDLLWKFDAVRRLRDAYVQKDDVDELQNYIEPGCFWWAFDIETASQQGKDRKNLENSDLNPHWVIRDREGPSVILLDEIDKADPDMPNDLLVIIGSRQFHVTEAENVPIVAKKKNLIIITSNETRALPKAFIRRCIVFELSAPNKEELIQIAVAHFPNEVEIYSEMFEEIADRVVKLRDNESLYVPSTAEFLDAVRACIQLKVKPDASDEWKVLSSAILSKAKGS